MASIEVKNFANNADDVSTPSNARVETVNVGGQRVIKITLKPGWKWSNDVKPQIGTDSCQATHTGVITSGKICAKMDDSTEIKYSAGDAYHISPGHDAWVEGDESVTAYEFGGMWGE